MLFQFNKLNIGYYSTLLELQLVYLPRSNLSPTLLLHLCSANIPALFSSSGTSEDPPSLTPQAPSRQTTPPDPPVR